MTLATPKSKLNIIHMYYIIYFTKKSEKGLVSQDYVFNTYCLCSNETLLEVRVNDSSCLRCSHSLCNRGLDIRTATI